MLIEPTTQYNELVNNRPTAFNFNYAVSESEGIVDFVGNDALGGIKETMHDNHYFGWKLNEQKTYKVNCF